MERFHRNLDPAIEVCNRNRLDDSGAVDSDAHGAVQRERQDGTGGERGVMNDLCFC